MTRVYICEKWNSEKKYWEFIAATDSADAADRWRRDASQRESRKFVDYVVYNADEFKEFLNQEHHYSIR